jgi:polysaccharide deacetylase family protein (PEP-CTERM system associated)
VSPWSSAVRHHFTVDLEEHFQVSAFEPFIARSQWDRLESRVEVGAGRLLDLLERYEVRATFFVLGWVAERRPALVRRIADAGHEVASHGWDHRRVTELRPAEFRDSVRRTKARLEEIVGAPVVGFRAPSFSIVPGREWALDMLLEEGYRYDSSLFPIRRRGYGYPSGRRAQHWIRRPAGRLLETPPATWRVWGWNLPAAGGGYFRLLPYALVRAALRDLESLGAAGTFYIHPWEVDPEQPRFDVPAQTRIRHYAGLERTLGRLERLLGEFRFAPIAETLNRLEAYDRDARPVDPRHGLRQPA